MNNDILNSVKSHVVKYLYLPAEFGLECGITDPPERKNVRLRAGMLFIDPIIVRARSHTTSLAVVTCESADHSFIVYQL